MELRWSNEPKPKFDGGLPGYFFIFVKVIKIVKNDLRSTYDFLLISLAKRFNTAYDLLLNTGQSFGVESDGLVDVVGCGGNKRQNCRTP